MQLRINFKINLNSRKKENGFIFRTPNEKDKYIFTASCSNIMNTTFKLHLYLHSAPFRLI